MAYRRTARSEQARDASRDTILAAAQKLMTVYGFERTTMQQIVDEAGTSIGNAYFYFRNKEELFTEVLRRATHDMWHEAEESILTVPAGPRRIAVIIHGNIRSVLGETRKLAKAILEVHDRIEKVKEYSIARWSPVLDSCCPKLSSTERIAAAAAIFGANRAIVERAMAGVLPGTPEEVADFAVRWNLRALGVEAEEIEAALRLARRRSRRAAK